MEFWELSDNRAMNISNYLGTLVFLSALFLTSCTPKVQVMAPAEPITINLNVKIDHEVRVRVEKDLDKVISKDSGLF